MIDRILSNVLGLVGAAVGGTLGFFLFRWILEQGFYALMLPGALLGLGGSIVSRHYSFARGVVCGLAALVLGLFTEWHFMKHDGSFVFLVRHANQLTPITQIMIAAGGLFGYWFGKDPSSFLPSLPLKPREDDQPAPSPE
jgi:hypothetical protein